LKRITKYALSALSVVAALSIYVLYPPAARPIVFPDGKKFAFTIVDDTDMARLKGIEPVYDLLQSLGLRTTKTVWVLESRDTNHSPNQGDSLQDAEYFRFIVKLERNGFEVALHGVRGGSSNRSEILDGLGQFRETFDQYPSMQINHSINRDNIHWGEDRMWFGPYRLLYSLVGRGRSSGHDPESAHFWGDIAKQHVRYVRRFTFPEINLLSVNPNFPYHITEKEYVNYWFPTSNGNNADQFAKLISKENVDKLEMEGGICIVYTHFGAGSFYRDGRVHKEFEERLRDLSKRDGWFVPATELLDYLRQQPEWRQELTFREKLRLDTLFLLHRVISPPN
jgi:hypothetical protein